MSETPTHLPFGELAPSTAIACNPYLTADQVPVEELHRFYLRSEAHHENFQRRGWLYLEAAWREPVYFDVAELELSAARDEALASGAQHRAHRLSVALAFVPAFREVAAHGRSSTQTADRLYGELGAMLSDEGLDNGLRGEIVLLGLGARAARTDPSKMLYPTSPREGQSRLYTADGRTYNHDAYMLAGAQKVPAEVKLQSDTAGGARRYAEPTFQFSIYNAVRATIQDGDLESLYPELHTSNLSPGMAVRKFLDVLSVHMYEEYRFGPVGHSILLERLSEQLTTNIEQHRAAYPVPGAEALTNPNYTTARSDAFVPIGASVAEIAVQILRAMASFPYDELGSSATHLTTAHAIMARLENTAGGSLPPELTAVLQNVSRERLDAVEGALAEARRHFNLYLGELGLQSRRPE